MVGKQRWYKVLLADAVITEHYCQAVGLLVVALSDQPELLRQTVTYVEVFHKA